ncbi:phenylalanine--tRNA ligase subunit alpha [Candidatus Peregrinibacteria bacterium]|nr:phenylalanine--tRNA ligase subunit alpha [Candidatus Peregrinibacteria bacterium]
MEQSLQKLEENTLDALFKANDLHQLREIEVKYLGRKGELTTILRGLKDLSAEQKRVIGQLANKIKIELENEIEKKRSKLENAELSKSLENEWIDLTAPGAPCEIGHIHPISQVQEEVETIFSQMGFAVMDGPEIESEYYNFEGLNIPAHHPARDIQDTFFIEKKSDPKQGKLVLRTHTSPVQVRTMEKYGAPLRIIVPGRVFRYEATDASHDSTFYQVEGLMIDKDISLASLKGVMKEFLSRLFGREVSVRFRPGYFPFVEPGLELDFSCLICDGKGQIKIDRADHGETNRAEIEHAEINCSKIEHAKMNRAKTNRVETDHVDTIESRPCRVCKQTGWMEFMGAGMVHPSVLKAGGIDSEKYQGWAFGFGLTRLVMMRYGIDDIRLLTSGDLRFLHQF